MPFDNTTGLVEAAPDLSKPTLEGLSWLLRHKEAWPPTFGRWNYRGCTTCAMGLAMAVWRDGRWYSMIEPAPAQTARMLDVPRVAADRLFTDMSVPSSLVTPEMVADRIDAYLRR